MVSQAPRIFTHMSVAANVSFPLRVCGVGRAEARVAALEQLRAVGIADLANKRASDLSGGQAARVAIARALVFRPEVLILDEPTAALDVEATAQVSAVLRERLAGSGITTLLVSHDIAEVLSLASHMIVSGGGAHRRGGRTRPRARIARVGVRGPPGRAQHREWASCGASRHGRRARRRRGAVGGFRQRCPWRGRQRASPSPSRPRPWPCPARRPTPRRAPSYPASSRASMLTAPSSACTSRSQRAYR